MADFEKGPEPAAGSILRPVHSVRNMRFYLVSDSELQNISLANLGMTTSVGIGSALIAFGANALAGIALSTATPEALAVVKALEPLAFIFGAIFYVIAGLFYWWRRGQLKTIREESKETSVPSAPAGGVVDPGAPIQ